MPNYCNNTLHITGKSSVLHNLLDTHIDNDGNFDFGTVIPYPQKYKDLDNIPADLDTEAYTQYILTKLKEHNLEELQSKITPEKYKLYKQGYDCGFGYNNGGYEWCCDNWGTKWNACDTTVIYNDDLLAIAFETAWSPSLPVTQKLSDLYKSTKIVHLFLEPIYGYRGHLVAKAGVVTDYLFEEYNDYYEDNN